MASIKTPRTALIRVPVPIELIERRICVIRGRKVMLDADLARLYHVTTGNLNLAVRRNAKRLPIDFMFQLIAEEHKGLLLQFAIAKPGRGGRHTLPYVFTEQGVAMLSSVLNSERAIQVNIAIMRAFLRMRELLATHKDLARKLEQLETTQKDHAVKLSVVAEDIQTLAKGIKKESKRLQAPRNHKARIGSRLPE